MVRTTAFCILVLMAFAVSAQSLERHRGTLRNGFTDDGEVTYSYRLDPNTRERIKQGSFRYIVRARDDQYRFNHTISGSYVDNLKDGEWSIRITQRDFMLQHDRRYTTGNVNIDGSYSKGLPDGPWQFESSLRSRAGQKIRDRWQWERHDSIETVMVSLQFTQGVITGPFYAKNDREWEVTGAFDEHGFFDGEWIWRFPDSTVIIQWDKGLQVEVTITDPNDHVLHHEKYELPVRMMKAYQQMVVRGDMAHTESPFTLDTLSMMNDRSYLLTSLLHNTIYHPQYTLNRQIGGDKAVFYDQRTYRLQFALRGMYYIEQRNRISSSQRQLYSRMHTLVRRMETHQAEVYRLRREGRLSGQQAAENARTLESTLAIARRYLCIGETLKLYLSTEEGLKASERSCAHHVVRLEGIPSFTSRDDALRYLVQQITELEKQHTALYQNLRRSPAR